MVKERLHKAIKGLADLSKKKGGKKSKRKIIKEAGYSDTIADNPKRLLNGKEAKELMAHYLPMDKVYRTHKELMEAAEIQHYVFPVEGRGKNKRFVENRAIKKIVESVPGCKLIYIKNNDVFGKIAFFQGPDNRSRKDAIDMAYKLHGKYAPTEVKFIDPYEKMSDEEIDKEIARLESELKHKKK